MYEELKDKNFELVAIAQDTAGEAVAGSFYDAANATFTTLNDVRHEVSSLYGMVNVPTAVWIDEQGNVVRQNEGAYSRQFSLGGMTIGTDEFTPALRDWVEHGENSIYALKPEQVAAKLKPRTADQALADASFRLGVYFHEQGNELLANKYWEKSQKLNPDSWNYHRQDWSFTPKEAMRNWLAKFRELRDKPYYEPLDLPKAEE